MPTRYPCSVCGQHCSRIPSSIECSICLKWTHRRCVPVDPDLMDEWSTDGLDFTCKRCAFHDGHFDVGAALERIYGAPSDQRSYAGRSEELLLKTYGIALPQLKPVETMFDLPRRKVDPGAEEILQRYHPVLLVDHVPVYVKGDGNCLYRAVSLGAFRNDSWHDILRLKVAIEMVKNQACYDTGSDEFVDAFQDQRLDVFEFESILERTCKLGGWCGMLNLSAASAVLGEPIHSYCPPTSQAFFFAESLRMVVRGRGVRPSRAPVCTVMWSMMTLPDDEEQFRPNHFAFICRRQTKAPCKVDLTADKSGDNDDFEMSKRKVGDSDSGADAENSDIDAGDYVADSDAGESVSENVSGSYTASSNNPSTSYGVAVDNVDVFNLENEDFNSTAEVLRLLREGSDGLTRIPRGPKENIAVILCNSANVERRKKDNRNRYDDDCGVWANTRNNKCHFFELPNGLLRKGFLHEGKLCREVKIGGSRTKVPYDPQPGPEDIVVLVRYYSTLAADPQYSRRITWVETGPAPLVNEHSLRLALVEYKGTWKGVRPPHGNSKARKGCYVRTAGTVIDQIAADRHLPPNIVYTKMVSQSQGQPIELQPRNKQQIKKKQRAERQKLDGVQGRPAGNLADQMLNLTTLTSLRDFLQCIQYKMCGPAVAPSVILFHEDQIQNLKAFCCNGRTVLGIDKTYNLADLLVTSLNFKNLSLRKEHLDHPPILAGPIFLHSTSTFEDFCYFLSTVAAALMEPGGTIPPQMVIGTDDEKALTRAVRAAFPSCRHALCTLHMKKNTIRHLRDKVGVETRRRNSLIDLMFGERGVVKSANRAEYDMRVARAAVQWPADDEAYFQKLTDQLKDNVLRLFWDGCISTPTWTNNNAESLNTVLKHLVCWNPQQLPQLVDVLRNLVNTQNAEPQRALVGIGENVLAPSHAHMLMSPEQWEKLSTDQQKQKLRMLRRPARRAGTVTSADNTFTVKSTPSKSKKPCQRKRKRSEKTTTSGM